MPGKWGQFRALSVDERRLFLAALLWLPVVQIGLLLVGYRRMRRLLIRWKARTPPSQAAGKLSDHGQVETARQVGWIVNIAAGRRALGATCLARSLLAWWFLQRQGIESTVVFGVPTIGPAFTAHAWVEVADVVVNDAPDVRDRFGVLEAVNPPG